MERNDFYVIIGDAKEHRKELVNALSMKLSNGSREVVHVTSTATLNETFGKEDKIIILEDLDSKTMSDNLVRGLVYNGRNVLILVIRPSTRLGPDIRINVDVIIMDRSVIYQHLSVWKQWGGLWASLKVFRSSIECLKSDQYLCIRPDSPIDSINTYHLSDIVGGNPVDILLDQWNAWNAWITRHNR